MTIFILNLKSKAILISINLISLIISLALLEGAPNVFKYSSAISLEKHSGLKIISILIFKKFAINYKSKNKKHMGEPVIFVRLRKN